ncbi:MAG: hypothetical protein WCJ30_27165, partial [Deltaproteobacteria bacterium]
MDTQLGKLVRGFKARGALGAVFAQKDPAIWSLEAKPESAHASAKQATAPSAGKPPLQITFAEAPIVYVVETGIVFIVLGVRPANLTLANFQDLYHRTTRKGVTHLHPGALPAAASQWKVRWTEHGAADTTLRSWLAALVPGLALDRPTGGPRFPQGLGVLFVAAPLDAQERHRLRLAQGTGQHIEPSEPDQRVVDHPAIWQPSALETCLFSPFGVTWVVHGADRNPYLIDRDQHFRDKYLYKWILVENQRLTLLALSTGCAEAMSPISVGGKLRKPDGAKFRELRLRLLHFMGQFDFTHISAEEIHDR